MGSFKHMEDKIRKVHSLVEIGPGIRPQLQYAQHYVGVEPHEEYASICVQKGVPVIKGTALNILRQMYQVNTILMLDVLEHMPREEGLQVLELAKKLATEQLVVFTTLGFIEQSYKDGEKDAWGLNGGYWQTHRSAWQPEDFHGWDLAVDPEFHGARGGAIFAIYDRSRHG